MKRTAHVVLALSSILLITPGTISEETARPETLLGMPLVFEDDFEQGSAHRWEPVDAAAWKVVKEDDNNAYALLQDCDYSPTVRSPVNISLIKELSVSDFVFQARFKSTEHEYGHRDMCIFFGHQDPTHFYYVHFGKKADEHANSIFIVNGVPRVSIATDRTEGTNWDDSYHTVRVTRDVETGTIAVYFDDLETPVMRANDKTFTTGRIGVGSFDDVGLVDDVTVWGKNAAPPPTRGSQ
jgi:hypothetical protein